MLNKLNFGCGKDIRKGFINVDILKRIGIDKSFDFEKEPYPFQDNTFDYVLANDIFEHLRNPEIARDELYRICKDKAIIEILVPYYNSFNSVGDFRHHTLYNEKTIEVLFYGGNSYETNNNRFRIIKIKFVPVLFLKWIPNIILRKLCHYIGNIVTDLDVRVEVRK